MTKTKSFRSEAHFSPKSETEFENETERDCGIALRASTSVFKLKLMPPCLFCSYFAPRDFRCARAPIVMMEDFSSDMKRAVTVTHCEANSVRPRPMVEGSGSDSPLGWYNLRTFRA